MPECFFAHLGGCEGRLVKAHLVPKTRLRNEYPFGAVFATEQNGDFKTARWRPFDPRLAYAFLSTDPSCSREQDEIVWDPRCWCWMCGGSTGIGGHHGAFDAKQIRLDEWPADLLEFLAEYGIEWMAEAYAR